MNKWLILGIALVVLWIGDRVLRRVYLPYAAWTRRDLRGVRIPGAWTFFPHLENRDLSGAALPGAMLKGASLVGAKMAGADLRRANLIRADLKDADLRGALLSNACLVGAILENANLRGAYLDGADLWDCILYGADLSGASVVGTKVEYCYYDRYTRWPAGFDPKQYKMFFEIQKWSDLPRHPTEKPRLPPFEAP